MKKSTASITENLLCWYDSHKRTLPWRTTGNRVPDPYHVWLSEVMLQQTTVATVKPRFLRFLQRWPDVSSLARASLDDVLHEWQGLGYYARARNLHRCARTVHYDLGGDFPACEAELRALPGIGDYTAAAIAAVAFGQVTAPVDGNIMRVISRLDALEAIMPRGKGIIQQRVRELMPRDRAGDFAQAMMDLGAGICAPRKPDCANCPWLGICKAARHGNPADYPRKAPRREKPVRHSYVFWIQNAMGEVCLRRRPARGLLGGMMEFPSTPWREVSTNAGIVPVEDAAGAAGAAARAAEEALVGANVANAVWQHLDGEVSHTFTHFHLRLMVLRTVVDNDRQPGNGYWSRPEDLHHHALPTLMKKVAAHVASTPQDSQVADRRQSSGYKSVPSASPGLRPAAVISSE